MGAVLCLMKRGRNVHRRLRLATRIFAASALVLCVLLFPLPVRDADRAYVVQRDAMRLRDVEPVFVDWWWRPFYDARLIAQRNPKWHLYSDLNLDFRLLEDSGFSRMETRCLEHLSWAEWYEKGNVLLEITDKSGWDDTAERGLRFHVHHGWLGGQGYIVHIYRCLLGRFARYTIEWVS